jgi:hypothetical protein
LATEAVLAEHHSVTTWQPQRDRSWFQQAALSGAFIKTVI